MKKILVCLLFMYGFTLSALETNFHYELEKQILAELTQIEPELATLEDQEKIPHLNQQNKDKYLKLSNDKPLIIFAFADWCAPCKMLAPIVEELDREHGKKYQFLRLNVDNQAEITILLGISAIPAIVVVENEKVKGEVVGSMPKGILWRRINAILND